MQLVLLVPPDPLVLQVLPAPKVFKASLDPPDLLEPLEPLAPPALPALKAFKASLGLLALPALRA